ncbi:MAG: hypothetical protein ACLFQK_07630 [Fibrobacterota bacterium]
MKLFTLAAMVVSAVFIAGAESPLALYGSVHGSGVTSGGLRYSLSDDVCFDVSAGAMNSTNPAGESVTGFDVYADAFFFGQTWGLAAALSSPGGDADNTITVGIAYALEKEISESVYIGVAPSIASVSMEGDADPVIGVLNGWGVYVVLGM